MRLDSYHKEFIRGYIAAALWSSYASVGEDDILLDDSRYGEDALAFSTVKRMRNNCILFLNNTVLIIDACVEHPDYDLDYSQAGHDFWLTQAGHGAGFWDGDWPEPYASTLTAMAKSFKPMELYIGDDGKIYA